jgi:hypothetical protein
MSSVDDILQTAAVRSPLGSRVSRALADPVAFLSGGGSLDSSPSLNTFATRNLSGATPILGIPGNCAHFDGSCSGHLRSVPHRLDTSRPSFGKPSQ